MNRRHAIEAVLAAGGRPMTPPELHAAARSSLPRLGIATVYRAIREGLDAGRIATVEIPGTPTRYESAHAGHHHHFHCTRCGRVYEIHACPGDLAALAPRGFTVTGHDLTLSGCCADCGT